MAYSGRHSVNKKKQKIAAILIAVSVLVLLLVAAWMVPYWMADSEMPANVEYRFEIQNDSTLLASWTSATECSGYLVDIYDSDGAVLYETRTVDAQCVLPDLSDAGTVTLSVDTWRSYSRLGMEYVRVGESPDTLSIDLAPPGVSLLTLEADPDTKTVTVAWELGESGHIELAATKGEETTELGEFTGSSCVVNFADGGELVMPEYGETIAFSAKAVVERDDYVFVGASSVAAELVREDLLGLDLNLECTDEGHNVYTLNWSETKGEGYRVQLRSAGGEWETVAEIDKTAELSYTTSRLAPYEDFELQVLSYGENSEETVAGPEATAVTTAETAIYASIWPIQDLELYSDVERTEVLCTVPQAKLCCVIAEEEGMFVVRYEDYEGYIDSNYCMINLPDYIGHLCEYNITNSYSSLYMVHEFEIPEVTDTVVAGYEYIELSAGEYLVPLLYPAAKKLVNAAESAVADGYKIKIYDAFRPNQATRSIYDLTETIIENPIPEETFTGVEIEELNLPEPAEGAEYVTYYQLVTNGTYNLANFLARHGSNHNLGIAMDMTLVALSTDEDLEMQTSMHDLSWYSALSENNSNAYLLSTYMTEAGFGGLTSEWWHFQDNDAKSDLALSNYMWSGVSSAGWHNDGNGWSYCTADGTPLRSSIVEIGSTEYTFDSDGYQIEEE